MKYVWGSESLGMERLGSNSQGSTIDGLEGRTRVVSKGDTRSSGPQRFCLLETGNAPPLWVRVA